jgi:predicted acetyltransferase
MTEHAEKPPARLEFLSATRDHQPILANLLELYIHDFSEFLNVVPGPDGRFGYPRLPLYWSDPSRHPFLVKVDGQWAGFALVKQGSEVSDNADVWDIAEFFVLRGYRRQGIGTQIAKELWRRLPGPWEVRVMASNIPARGFWAAAIASFTGKSIHPVRLEKDGERWNVFSFASPPDRLG